MFERERTDPQTDIEFDFFDESPTAETPAREASPRRRRRLPTRPPAPPGGSGLYRLGILIAGAIVLAVILILAVNSCRASQKQSEYKDYMGSVSAVAADSEALGRQLNTQLTTPGIKLEELRSDVDGLREQQEQLLRRAQELSPPGPLVEQQQSLIQAMQFRVNGLAGLAQAFVQVAQSRNADEAGNQLASQASRLVASDVVYDDLFKEGAEQALREQEVTDVAVPASRFVRNQELASPAQWKLVVERLTRSPEAGGLHGNGIAGVRVRPSGNTLSASEDNTVKASADLAFQVLVENSGNSQETQVVVTLVIQQDPVIRKRAVIDVINPQTTEAVTFRNFGDISFSTRTTLKVSIEPVAGEQNTANNTAQYAVIFTLS